MKNFLLSLKFIIKRVFRLTAANIAWLIVTALIVAIGTAAMGVSLLQEATMTISLI